MKKFYEIRHGFSVKLPDLPDVYLAGGVIELDDETAAVHIHKLEPLSTDRQAEIDAERAAVADELAQRDQQADADRRKTLEADAAAKKAEAKAAADAVKAQKEAEAQ